MSRLINALESTAASRFRRRRCISTAVLIDAHCAIRGESFSAPASRDEGYAASMGGELVRVELCAEAIRPARVVAELMPDEPEAIGLLALMLLIQARRETRTTPAGDLALLKDRDRSRWDRRVIDEGQALVRECLRRGQRGPCRIQAAINAVQSDAPTAPDTEWGQILKLYDQLSAVAPGPVVSLHRAVAVAEVHGPAAALALIEDLKLERYHLFYAIRADLLRRLGRYTDAAAACEVALEHTDNGAECRFLERRLAQVLEPHMSSPDAHRETAARGTLSQGDRVPRLHWRER